MEHHPLVVKSNALIDASYRLSLNEQRLMLFFISQVRRDKPITDQVMYSISAEEFSKSFEVEVDTSYKDLKSAAISLKRREVRITQEANGRGQRKEILITGWVQSIKYIEGSGIVSLRFNHDILPYLTELNKCFTSYKLKNIIGMSSSYGVRIYELLMQWKDAKQKEISLEWLRHALDLDKKYESIKDFKKNVLDMATRDINKHSDLNVTWTQRKTGRKVTHIIFHFKPKKKLTQEKTKLNNEQKIFGLKKTEIEKKARPGETYEQAALRITSTQK